MDEERDDVQVDIGGYLADLGGDAELAEELVDIFLEDAPSRVDDIEEGLDDGDLDLVARQAHTLKSSGRRFGAPAFADQCEELEEAARDGDADAAREAARGLRDRYEAVAGTLAEARDEGFGL